MSFPTSPPASKRVNRSLISHLSQFSFQTKSTSSTCSFRALTIPAKKSINTLGLAVKFSGFLVALSKRGIATSFQPPQLRSARIPCNLRENSVDADAEVDAFEHVDVNDHVRWRNLRPGPSHSGASDAMNNAEVNLSNAGCIVSLSNGRELIRVNRTVW